MKTILKLLLFTFSLILALALCSIGMIYTLIKSIFVKGILEDFFFMNAFTIDQSGNVVNKHWFNDWMVKPSGHRFGNPDETISYVMGVNKRDGNLYLFGKLVANIIDLFAFLFGANKWDRHCLDAAENPQKN